jgi:phenylalanyl-tRNA synthetase beta chain
MGGKSSAITDKTTSIILESASFNASSIRLTQRKYNLQTDAAYRFERDLDPNIAELATLRAIDLFEELTGGKVSAIKDVYPNPVVPWTVDVSVEKVNKLLGTSIEQDEMKEILERLGMTVKVNDEDIMIITVPTVRLDIKTQEDVIEEIGRIYGYDKIEPKPLSSAVQTPHRNELRFFERTIKDVFVYGGFDEVRGYSFYSNEDASAVGLDDEKHIALMNPANPNQSLMRRTLMPSLLNAVKKNFSYFDRVQVFEIGRIYDPVANSLPDEKLVLGAVVASKGFEGTQFFEMKGIVEMLLDRINIGKYYLDTVFDENVQHVPNLHPSRRALVRMESGKIIGWLGEVDKKASKYFGLKKNRAVVCELNIDAMLSEVQSENFFEPLAKYPFVSRDLSMIVGERVLVGDVERITYAAAGELVRDVDLFDLYKNEETGEKSMAFHILFGNDDRTLKAKEVDEKIAKIIEELEKELDIEVKK